MFKARQDKLSAANFAVQSLKEVHVCVMRGWGDNHADAGQEQACLIAQRS